MWSWSLEQFRVQTAATSFCDLPRKKKIPLEGKLNERHRSGAKKALAARGLVTLRRPSGRVVVLFSVPSPGITRRKLPRALSLGFAGCSSVDAGAGKALIGKMDLPAQ
jgi:hypothetical protein